MKPSSDHASPFMAMNIRVPLKRPILLLAAIFIGVSGLLVAATLWVLRSQAIENGRELTASFAYRMMEQTASALQSVDQGLQLGDNDVAKLAAAGSLNVASANAQMRERIKGLPFVRAMWVMNAQGRIIYNSNAESVGMELGDREYFTIYLKQPHTTFNIAAPIRSRSSGKWIMTATRPLRAPDGSFAGIIVAAVSPTWFDTLWETTGLGEDSSAALIRRDGMLMMCSPFDEAKMGKVLPSTPGLDGMKAGPGAGTFENTSLIDGVPRHYAYRTMATHPELMLLVGQSHSEILAQWRSLATPLLVLWATAAAFIMLLAYFLDRGAGQRIRAERFAAQIADTVPGMVALWSTDLRCAFSNSSYISFFGRTKSEMLGIKMQDLLGDALFQKNEPYIRAALAGEAQSFERTMTKVNGEPSYSWVQYIPQWKDGKSDGFLALITDVSEIKKIQEALQVSLEEKNALLKEVHHRVKNNLQVITSLLRLESFRSKDAPSKAVLQDMQGRVRAMALLHETIYRKGTFAAIDLGSYIAQIANESLKSMQVNPGAVRLQLDVETLHVGLDQATPAGMLVSELMSNCLKHAFPAGRTGEIAISLHPLAEPAHWRLSVSDTGVGLPADFEARRKNSLGLQLVGDMATQMGGALQMDVGPRAIFTVDFKAEVSAPIVNTLEGESK